MLALALAFGLAGKEIARESLERLLRRRGPEDEDGLKHLLAGARIRANEVSPMAENGVRIGVLRGPGELLPRRVHREGQLDRARE